MASRADLARVATRLGAGGLAAVAELMGYAREVVDAPPAVGVPVAASVSKPIPAIMVGDAVPAGSVPFWRPVACEFTEEDEIRALAMAVERDQAAARSAASERGERREPVAPPLSAWRRLGPLLQRALTADRPGHAIDIPALLRRCGRGRSITSLPRRRRRGWVSTLVLVDRPFRLVPVWDDQRAVVQALRRAMGAHAVTVRVLADGPESLTTDGAGRPASLRGPALVGMPVLVLGDLGWYGGRAEQRGWLRLARELGRAGERLLALVPVPRARWNDPLARSWGVMPWERPAAGGDSRLDAAAREARARRLLTLLAPAMRIEPGLLRSVRRILPRDEADIGTEADVWAHQDLAGMFPEATTIKAGRAEALRRAFVQEVEATRQRRALDELRAWHWNARRSPEAWHVEVLGLESARAETTSAAVFEPAEVARAERFMVALTAELCDAPLVPNRVEPLSRWYRFIKSQERGMWRSETAAGRALQMLGFRIGDDDVPDADPRLYALAVGVGARQPREYTIYQVGEMLEIGPRGRGGMVSKLVAAGSMAHVRGGGSPERLLQLQRTGQVPARPVEALLLRTDRQTLRLEPIVKPPWASAIGRDARGLWAELARKFGICWSDPRVVSKLEHIPTTPLLEYLSAQELSDGNLRMRWIPPSHPTILWPQDRPDSSRQGEPLTNGFWLSESRISKMLSAKSVQYLSSLSSTVLNHNFLEMLNLAVPSDDGEVFRRSSPPDLVHARRAGMDVEDAGHLVRSRIPALRLEVL